jgi:hypothetical protein
VLEPPSVMTRSKFKLRGPLPSPEHQAREARAKQKYGGWFRHWRRHRGEDRNVAQASVESPTNLATAELGDAPTIG